VGANPRLTKWYYSGQRRPVCRPATASRRRQNVVSSLEQAKGFHSLPRAMWACASSASLCGSRTSALVPHRHRWQKLQRASFDRPASDRAPGRRGVPIFRSVGAEGFPNESPVSGDDDEDDEIPTTSDSPRWRVRAASDADIDAVVRLAADAGVDWSAEQVAEEVTKGNALVAFRASPSGPWDSADSKSAREEIAGFAVVWVVDAHEVQILEVATGVAHRRQGVGTLLVRAALDAQPGADCTLEVRAGNEAARNLYAKIGFAVVGNRKRYYADGEDAALMTRPAAPAVSARELTRLLAGLSPEEARRPPPPTPEEKQRGSALHVQDYPRKRAAFRRNASSATTPSDGEGEDKKDEPTAGSGFRMRNRVRKHTDTRN